MSPPPATGPRPVNNRWKYTEGGAVSCCNDTHVFNIKTSVSSADKTSRPRQEEEQESTKTRTRSTAPKAYAMAGRQIPRRLSCVCACVRVASADGGHEDGLVATGDGPPIATTTAAADVHI